jgi:hypothetical protein
MQQNIAYHDRIVDLEFALRMIALKTKMDATAAVSMRAIARSALGAKGSNPDASATKDNMPIRLSPMTSRDR